ncbi:MAG TPA: TetR/AcrR family transcriptional regulator [Ramlibacter sp.]|nr:TetR/AcrR family transcriptional regulator [Ramlibacter sp.]
MTNKSKLKPSAAARPSGKGRKRPVPEDHRVRTGAARREQTRRKLLVSALAVVAQKGVDAPQIDDFIAAAGVSRGTFYNHFTTTHELLAAVTAELTDTVLSAIETTVARIPDPLHRMACACLVYMHLAVDYPAWGGFVLRTGTRRGRLMDVYLPRDLALAKERGEADFPTVRAAQDVLQGSLTLALESILAGRAPREHVRDTLALALRAIGVPKAAAARLAALPEEEVELPEVLRMLKAR